MAAAPLTAPRFIRKTQLGAHEYRKNFRQIDREVIAALTSPEADAVTPLMSKVYLRLTNAPDEYWERDGVLRVEAEVREGKQVKSWAVLCELAGVASATASKALRWMHDEGIIGYFSGKNGVGLRIFFNRAASSVGVRPAQGGKKILAFPPTSSCEARGSQNEVAFSDSFAVLEVSDTGRNPRAPKNGAEEQEVVNNPPDPQPAGHRHPPQDAFRVEVPVGEIVARLKDELKPSIRTAARRAAAQEHERTREWLESRGLPKAARVAQREAYNVLRKYGVVNESARGPRAHSEVGRGDYAPPVPHSLTPEEVAGLAQACVAMLETRGQSVELTLSEMSADAGGFLLPEDAPRVREKANALLAVGKGGAGK